MLLLRSQISVLKGQTKSDQHFKIFSEFFLLNPVHQEAILYTKVFRVVQDPQGRDSSIFIQLPGEFWQWKASCDSIEETRTIFVGCPFSTRCSPTNCFWTSRFWTWNSHIHNSKKRFHPFFLVFSLFSALFPNSCMQNLQSWHLGCKSPVVLIPCK